MKIRYIDLFAGMGGMRLALEQVLKEKGFQGECVLTSEIKTSAINVYKQNFGSDNFVGDISQVSVEDIPDFDILLAGFPCQPFSSAGCRRGFEDTRGTLFFEIARILKDKKPKYFLLENVENLVIHDLSKENKKEGKEIGKTLETILSILNELGYKVNWKVLNSEDFGVPQSRKRIYIVGSKDKIISLNHFEKSYKVFGDIQEHIENIEDTWFNQCCRKYLQKNNFSWDFLYGKFIRDKRSISDNNLHSWYLGLRGSVNNAQIELLDKIVKERRNKSREIARKIPIKDGLGLTKEELKILYNGADFENDLNHLLNLGHLSKKSLDEYSELLYDISGGNLSFEFRRIVDPRRPCPTLVATDANRIGVIDGNKIRKLTLREGLRLQGYPEDFLFDIEYRKGMDLLGNTVSVPVISQILRRMVG